MLLYYVQGLSSAEVAERTGERPGTVRVRLHRARHRLRERLPELAPQAKEVTMVEVELDDVIVRLTDEKELAGEHRIIVLKEKGGERMLPIWVGAPEGDALALWLGGEAMPRPLTVELMAGLLEAVGARVERVLVNSLREGTFYATVVLDNGSEVDSVPATRSTSQSGWVRPCSSTTRSWSRIPGDRAAALRADEAQLGLEAERPGEWQTLSAELVKELHPSLGKK